MSTPFVCPSLSGVSLQIAYNGGNTILETLAGGPVAITNPAATAQSALTVVQNTAGQFAADFTGDVRVTGKLTVTGLIDPTALILSPAGGSLYVEIANSIAPVSGANTGRIRYESATQQFFVSMNGAAYVALSTGSTSLQGAYNGGNTIVEAGGLAVAISSTTADNSSVLTVTKNPGGAQSGVGIGITMGATTTGNGITVTMTAGATGLALLASGGSISSPGAGATSERYGSGAIAAGIDGTAIGNSASASATDSTAVGKSAVASNSNAVAVGAGSTASGNGSVAINGTASASSTIAIGTGVSATGVGAIGIGANITATGAKFVASGGAGAPIQDVYFGSGVTAATPVAYTIHATGGSGAAVAGAALGLAAGQSGDAATAGGNITFGVSKAGTGTATTTILTLQSDAALTAVFAGAVTIAGKLTVTGAIDPPSLSLSGGTALFIDSADGSTAAVSGANHGRIRYLNGVGWQVSANTGAYATIATGAGTWASTLASGAISGGTSPIVSAGDRLAFTAASAANVGLTNTGTTLNVLKGDGSAGANLSVGTGTTTSQIFTTGRALSDEGFGAGVVLGGGQATACGAQADGSGANSVAVGYQSTSQGVDSVAVGGAASTSFGGPQTGGVAVGRTAIVKGAYSIAIGYQSIATAAHQFNIGDATGYVTSYNFGDGITASTAPHATTFTLASPISAANGVGVSATLQAGASKGSGAGGSLIFQTTAAGGGGGGQNAYSTVVTMDSTGLVTINQSKITSPGGTTSEQFGASASAPGNNCTAVGALASAAANGGTAIGKSANANTTNATCLGFGAASTASGNQSVCVGLNATSTGGSSTVMGDGANSNSDSTVCIGPHSPSVTAAGVMLAGSGSSCSAANCTILGTTSSSAAAESVVVGKSSSNAAAGTNNVIVGNAASINGQPNSVCIGYGSTNNGSGGSQNTLVGYLANTNAKDHVTCIGASAFASGDFVASVGYNAGGSGTGAACLGYAAQGNANYAIAIGYNASTSVANQCVIGPSGTGATTSIVPGSNGACTLGTAALSLLGIYLDYTNTATIGAVTINKPSGRAIIATGATSVVVTNSRCTAKAHIFLCFASTNPTAVVSFWTQAGAGTFTVNISSAAAADLPFDFLIINAD